MKVESNKNKLKKCNKESSNILEREDAEGNNDLKETKEFVILPSEPNESSLLIKKNKKNHHDKYGLKIPSVGNEPILQIDKSKKKPPINTSEANLKRLQSLNNSKKNYQNQKFLIQAALSNVDKYPNNKIIFEDDINGVDVDISAQKKLKKNLFDEDQSEDEETEVNFAVKEQFQTKEGQKLLELQTKYKNDKRFALDSRFFDENEKQGVNNEEGNEEHSFEEEKEKEYKILEEVLGQNISKSLHKREQETQNKAMLRFDPTQPEHSKFEIKNEVQKKKKRKRNDEEADPSNNKRKSEEEETPTVSKETFYKVTDNLKESLHEKQEFSLLNMFGKPEEREENNQHTETFSKKIRTNSLAIEKNPFKYDSSDGEDETEDIPDKNAPDLNTSLENFEAQVPRKTYWNESFFFKDDDYRLQEGFDFIEKMRSEETTEFSKLRRDLKEIVKAKVRNNQRKHKPFKKKLGGNKRKKMLKMKKALKR